MGGVDKDGWQYAKDYRGPFFPRAKFRSHMRRRRWMRSCSVVTTGPWIEAGPQKLLDVSIQMDVENFQNEIAVWAIGAGGEVLCRLGVSNKNPKGDSWTHISTDLKFVSISIGANSNVWAIAKDGSAWYRSGVTPETPTGKCWYQIPPPSRTSPLCQVSAGLTAVWAVDGKNVAYLRSGISTRCQEGQSWVRVCDKVKQVSISAQDHIWALLNQVPSANGPIDGVIARRVGIPADKPDLGSWDCGVGGGWNFISARGWLK